MNHTLLKAAAACTLLAATSAQALPLQNVDSPVTQEGGASRGVAWGDFDKDGDADLVISNAGEQPLFLYRNSGGEFERVNAPFGGFRGHSEGIVWIDYDNDGRLDLFVARTRGPNVLFKNETGGFRRVAAGPLTSDDTVSSQGCWADFDNDGWLDVFVVNRGGQDDVLYRNVRGRSFERVEGPFTGRGGDARTCAAGDANGDRLPDIYVGNFVDQRHKDPRRKASNFFYLNKGGGKFEKVMRGHFVNTPSLTYGASWVDFDQDKDLDLFLTNISLSDRNILYENLGDGEFYPREDLVLTTDSVGPSKGHSWGDFDNDGDLDLIVAEGTENITKEDKAQGFDAHNRLYLNEGAGRFTVSQGRFSASEAISAGTAWADHDLDGDLDIAVANWGGDSENNHLYKNSGRGNWITLVLRGTRSNRQGIGANVTISVASAEGERVQHQWLWPQTGYASMNEPVLHFGLGRAKTVGRIRIVWPSGEIDEYGEHAGNARYLAVEGENTLETVRPPRKAH